MERDGDCKVYSPMATATHKRHSQKALTKGTHKRHSQKALTKGNHKRHSKKALTKGTHKKHSQKEGSGWRMAEKRTNAENTTVPPPYNVPPSALPLWPLPVGTASAGGRGGGRGGERRATIGGARDGKRAAPSQRKYGLNRPKPTTARYQPRPRP